MNPETIAALLEQIQNDDEGALVSLYDAYANAVYSVAVQVVQQPQNAEEITQDVFLRLWRKSDTYDPTKGSFLTWLLTITRRLAIDFIRRQKRASQVPTSVSFSEQPQLWESLGGRDDLTELQQTILSTLQELPTEYQMAIRLAYFGGMTHQEIAQHLDRPLGTVKSHIRQGMEKLRLIWLDSEGERDEKVTS